MAEKKDPIERKKEIMTAASDLFHKKGYLNTTTQDIIKKVGISRGLLYYHFKSKEDILYHIVEGYLQPLIKTFERITTDETLEPIEKVIEFINHTVISEEEAKPEDYSLKKAIHLPENSYMIDRINHKLSYKMTNYFTKIIEEGIAKEVFHVPYPKETAAFLMTSYTFVINDTTYHHNERAKANLYFKAYQEMLSKTLGLKENIF
jgi:AcrR family transcriptional regulator